MKAVDQSKDRMIEEAGYIYSLDRMMYVNRPTKKVFSVEFVQDHTEDELQCCINENSKGGAWRFYVNSPFPDSVRREIESLLNHG